MRWFVKLADKWHGDTLEGQLYKRELSRISKDLTTLVRAAVMGKLGNVLPRWRGEVRRAILLLPAADKLPRMSMMELKDVSKTMTRIKSDIKRYNDKRMREILAGDESCQ